MEEREEVVLEQISPVEYRLRAGSREIFLLGTAHVSEKSISQTVEAVDQFCPDCICVELDPQRYQNLIDRDRWQNLDLFKTLKEGKGFLLLFNLLLVAFQNRIGRSLEVLPGGEIIRAVELAGEREIALALIDRPIDITLKRAWSSCNLVHRFKLFNSILSSIFEREGISQQEIEELKQSDAIEKMIGEFAGSFPGIKGALIDERDIFLARSIAEAKGGRLLAVLGAGHLSGVIKHLQILLESPKEPSGLPDLEALSEVPPPPRWKKLIPWLVPALVVGIIGAGFFFSDSSEALEGLWVWIVSHSLLAGLFGVITLAHPLSILVAAVSSPFTALNPTVSVGLVTALTETYLRRPKIADVEQMLHFESWKDCYKNRVWHVLTIFVGVSFGGALATAVALPWLTAILS